MHYLDRKKDARKKNGVKDRQCPSPEVDVPPHEVWPCSPAWLSLSWSLAGDVAQRRARRVERVDRPSGHRRYSTGRKLLKPIACTRARVGQHDCGDAWCESCHCIPRARRAGQRRRLSAMRVPKGANPKHLRESIRQTAVSHQRTPFAPRRGRRVRSWLPFTEARAGRRQCQPTQQQGVGNSTSVWPASSTFGSVLNGASAVRAESRSG